MLRIIYWHDKAVERYNEKVKNSRRSGCPQSVKLKRNGAYYPIFFKKGIEEQDRAFDYLENALWSENIFIH